MNEGKFDDNTKKPIIHIIKSELSKCSDSIIDLLKTEIETNKVDNSEDIVNSVQNKIAELNDNYISEMTEFLNSRKFN